VIATERKKLTIFFSDIVGFTSTAERLQPEEFTALLNEYLTEMSAIAARHGGIVNKFIGDAILIFFGDVESRGVQEDAKACLRMVFEMQRRLVELNSEWRPARHRGALPGPHGHQHRFCQRRQLRQQRTDGLHHHRRRGESGRPPAIDRQAGRHRPELRDLYAGAEPAARAPLEPITLNGISQPVVPYEVEGPVDEDTRDQQLISEHGAGLNLFIDVRAFDRQTADRVRAMLEKAIDMLKKKGTPSL